MGEIRTLYRMMRRNGWTAEQVVDLTGFTPDEKPLYERRLREMQAQEETKEQPQA